jgi:hypothetical protein
MDGTDIKAQIADELYTALEMQRVDRKLLAIVGTWKSSRPVDLLDREVLLQLRAYNAAGRSKLDVG